MKRMGFAKTVLAVIALAVLIASPAQAEQKKVKADWLAGDFHQHTTYTDGSTAFNFVMNMDNVFGLDWWANSEHGGGQTRDGSDHYWDDSNVYPTNPIKGDAAYSGGHQVMWRWQSLMEYAYPDILHWRALLPERRIVSGFEWNVPNHEHCSVGVIADDAQAISAFEFMFDASDRDTSRFGESTPFGILGKQNTENSDAVAAAAWMQKQFNEGKIDDAWIVFAHIERKGPWDPANGKFGYNVENFRDFNNAAPDICFGFEGAPGHQANSGRGGFGSGAFGGGTYGGIGYYTATVGGLWDALLGEGRHWFNFASSDYHQHYTAGGDDFYPGEYQKTYAYVVDLDNDGSYSLSEIAQALRSGNVYHVMGDLIDRLDFTAKIGGQVAPMGSDLIARTATGGPLTFTIAFHSPKHNSNGDVPIVDHIDLIGGEIYGPISPDDPNYTNPTNPTTQVLATFRKGDWVEHEDGTCVITFKIKSLRNSMYFRLRGTNVPVNTPYETDADGNPLPDSEATANLGLDGAAEAYADLWFYSNPIFVKTPSRFRR